MSSRRCSASSTPPLTAARPACGDLSGMVDVAILDPLPGQFGTNQGGEHALGDGDGTGVAWISGFRFYNYWPGPAGQGATYQPGGGSWRCPGLLQVESHAGHDT